MPGSDFKVLHNFSNHASTSFVSVTSITPSVFFKNALFVKLALPTHEAYPVGLR